MGLLKRSADLIYAFRFLKLLTTSFKDTEAYNLGIIDEKGTRDKNVKLNNPELRDAYTPFHRLVYNIKRLMSKVPGGGGKLASYAAAIYLIKEKYNLSDSTLQKALDESGYTKDDCINEQNQWFLIEGNQLAPGVYRIKNEKIVNFSFEELVNPKDKIRIKENAVPIGEVFGIDIYEATHINTNQKIYVTVGELLK